MYLYYYKVGGYIIKPGPKAVGKLRGKSITCKQQTKTDKELQSTRFGLCDCPNPLLKLSLDIYQYIQACSPKIV